MKCIYGMIGLLCLCYVSAMAGEREVVVTEPLRHTVVNVSEIIGTQVFDASQGIYKHTPVPVLAQGNDANQSICCYFRACCHQELFHFRNGY